MSSGTRTVLVIMMFLSPGVDCRKDFTSDGTYWRTHLELTQLPHNIPSQAKKIYLNNNIIPIIPKESFVNNSVCIKLKLDFNSLTEIRANMWSGLKLLKWLSLEHNNIQQIEPSAFADLPKLEGLHLGDNKLTVITEDIFAPGINLIRDMSIRGNPLHHGHQLCWIQKGHEAGWIKGMTVPKQEALKDMKYCTEILESDSKLYNNVTPATEPVEDETTVTITTLDIVSRDETTKSTIMTSTQAFIQPSKESTQRIQLDTRTSDAIDVASQNTKWICHSAGFVQEGSALCTCHRGINVNSAGNGDWILPVPVVYGIIAFTFIIITIIVVICFARRNRASKGRMVSQCQAMVEQLAATPHRSPQQVAHTNPQEEIELSRSIEARPVATLSVNPQMPRQYSHRIDLTNYHDPEDEEETMSELLLPLAGDNRPEAFIPSSALASNQSSAVDSEGYLSPVNEQPSGSDDYSYPYQDKIERFIAFLRFHLSSRHDEVKIPGSSRHRTRSQHAHLSQAHPDSRRIYTKKSKKMK